MTRVNRIAIVAAAIVGLSGCAAGEDLFGAPEAGYVEDMAALVAAADWSKAETVTVELSEFEFAPSSLTFRQQAPYRLRLENRGKATHFFVSEEFFKAIAIQRMETPVGEITMHYPKSISVAPGTEKELYFLPVREGAYGLKCTAPLHELFGMKGEITIQ